MSKENYETKLPVLEEMLSQPLLQPYMPSDDALQEAENLYVWALNDKKVLVDVGLDWDLWGEELPVRVGALRYAQSLWVSERNTQVEAQKTWETISPAAYELRNDLMASFNYAFRKKELLLGRVREIRKGSGHADMIQDLSDLSAVGKANTDELKKIKLDLSLLDKAATQAEELAELLAKVNGSVEENTRAKRIRDAAFAHLKEAVDEVRDAGKYAFRKNTERRNGYASEYNKR